MNNEQFSFEDHEEENLWCVKRNLFPCFISISKKDLTLEEAKNLSGKWNNKTDAYETYTYDKQ